MISASSHAPRLTRFAVLTVIGAAALSLAACGSSTTSSPTSSPSSTTSTAPTTSPAPANGEARVSGLIASVSGNTIQVTQGENGNATVDFTPSTKVTEVTPAVLTDVATGSCVSVRPTKEEGGQPVTAATVRVRPAVDGKCPQGKGAGPGSGPGATTPAPAKRPPVQGAVASVAGNTITLTTTDASGKTSQTAVTVNDKTKYTKQAPATGQAIVAGKCLAARGTKDPSGTLQATTVDLRPANDGKCGGGKPAHRGG
nr:DUF5666 domain-containing protein [Mycobacterium heidelbergense]